MKNFKIELKWAIVFTIAMLAWMWLEKTLGWHDEMIADHSWLTMLYVPIAILLYVLALREKRRRHFEGKMTWLQGLITGLKISIFVAILSPLVQYVTSEIISPDYFQNMIDYAVETGQSTREEAEAYFNLQSYLLQSTIAAFVMGALTSAVVALFLRKK